MLKSNPPTPSAGKTCSAWRLSLSSSLQLLLHCVIPLGAAHARRALGQCRVARPLLGCLCLDGQRVHGAAQLVLQSLVDQTVALDQRQTLELGADHQDAEVGLGAGGHGVHVALVVHLQVYRLEQVTQFGFDGFFNGPARFWVHRRSFVGQRTDKTCRGGHGASTAEDAGQHQCVGKPVGKMNSISENYTPERSLTISM